MDLNIILFNILLLPSVGIFLVFFIHPNEKRLLKVLTLNFSSICFIFFLVLWLFFEKATFKFQFLNKIIIFALFNLNFSVGIDGISLFFLFLTTLLVPICILSSWNSVSLNLKFFFLLFLFLKFLLVCVFSVLDVLFFYIFFETILIPMFLIIGIDRKSVV